MRPDPQRSSPRNPLLGFDLLRLTAIAVVAVRHLLQVSDIDSQVIPRALGIGVFSALSGYFAMRSRGGVREWLVVRSKKVYIPYWLYLFAVLGANSLIGYFVVSPKVLLAQFMGVIYFTSMPEAVGLHTWFITLMLVCYIMAALMRWNWVFLPALASFCLLLFPRDPAFVSCALSFLAGATLSIAPNFARAAIALVVASLLGVYAVHPTYSFPLAGVAAVSLGRAIPGQSPRALSRASLLVYDFFLMHMPVYRVLAKLAGFSFYQNLVFGTVVAIAAAWALHRCSHVVTSVLDDLLARIPRHRTMMQLEDGTPNCHA